MLIFRYLAKEVFTTLLALTTILMLIFMSNQFVGYLTRAASGKIPVGFILKLLVIELPMLLGLLMPLGFYIALMLAYGRLYADNEMTILQACGYAPRKLLTHSLMMAVVTASLVLAILLWINPAIALERTKLLRSKGIQVLIQTLEPSQFGHLPVGESVYYVGQMNQKKHEASDIFLARLNPKHGQSWDIFWAKKARVLSDVQTGIKTLMFLDGYAYQGEIGQADYRVIHFKQYETPLPEPVVVPKKGDLRALKTAELWPFESTEYAKAAEIVWRFSIPLMVLVLTLIAIPLSRVHPRSGKYAKLLPAILLFIVYADLLFVLRDAISNGKIAWWLGALGLHGSMAAIGIGLFWRNQVRVS